MEQIIYYLPLLAPLLLLIMGTVLLVTSKNRRARKIIATLQFNGAVFTVCNWFLMTKQMDIYLFLYGIGVACSLWIVPLIYWYLKCFVGTKIKKIAWHFIPGIFLGAGATLYLLLIASSVESHGFFNSLMANDIVIFINSQPLTLLHSLVVLLMGLQLLIYGFTFIPTIKKYNSTLEREYGNIDRFNILWIYNGFLLLVFIYSCMLVNQLFSIYLSSYNLLCLLGLFTIVLLFMGIKNKLQRYPVLVKQASWEQSFDTDREAEQLALNKLLHVFRVEQPFLNKDVNITDLSRLIAMDRNYIVSVINARMNMNFNMFVDRYRVNYIKKYKAENPNATHREVMKAAGFTSVKTFKSALKRL